MGDIPPPAGAANPSSREEGAPVDGGQASPAQSLQHSQTHYGVYQAAPYSSPPNQQYGNPQQHGYSPHLDLSQTQGSGRGGPFDMNAMAGALPVPQQSYRGGQYAQGPGQQRFSPQNAASPSNMPNPMSIPPGQYDGQVGLNPLANQQYYIPQHAAGMQQQQYYATSMSPPQLQTNVSVRSNMGYYQPAPVLMNQQASTPATYYYPQGPYAAQAQPQGMAAQQMPSQSPYYTPAQAHPDPRLAAAQPADHYAVSSFAQDRRSGVSPDSSRHSVVRGPPRKPTQTGHAIWIGNLPPQADLMQLVHHVCKEASGLESLFLISKSNCAFANFKDEPTCIAAQQKIHDSKFQSVRLVSRLRKNAVEGATGITAPTGPAATISSHQSIPAPTTVPAPAPTVDGASSPRPVVSGEPGSPAASVATSDAKPAAPVSTSAAGQASLTSQKDRFFILKSLTVEDLELSVQTGIWATQSHNEGNLNKAFQAAEHVYLVFSANKSGEYFGYARMTSPINNDPAAAIEFAPKAAAQTATDIDLPKAIPTEATEFAPKGRIIDDSARGTIFWEAERDESNEVQQQLDGNESGGGSSGPNSVGDASSIRSGYEGIRGGENQSWGKPFQLEWLSTNRLPFYRTRGLRNPWNSNREVKIARDGTELEPSVGRRLLALFSRAQSPVAPAHAVGPAAMAGMMPGYLSVRPPYQS